MEISVWKILSSMACQSFEQGKWMIENISSIVLQNLIGHMILKKPLNETGFIEGEYHMLEKALAINTDNGLEQKIICVVKEFIIRQYGKDGLWDYFSMECRNIAVRIWNAGQNRRLDRIFLK